MEDLKKAIGEIVQEKIVKVVISNKMNKDVEYNKISFVLKEKSNKEYYQIEKFTDKQVFHENINVDNLEAKMVEYVAENYKQLAAWSDATTFDMKISKKVKVFIVISLSNIIALLNNICF